MSAIEEGRSGCLRLRGAIEGGGRGRVGGGLYSFGMISVSWGGPR